MFIKLQQNTKLPFWLCVNTYVWCLVMCLVWEILFSHIVEWGVNWWIFLLSFTNYSFLCWATKCTMFRLCVLVHVAAVFWFSTFNNLTSFQMAMNGDNVMIKLIVFIVTIDPWFCIFFRGCRSIPKWCMENTGRVTWCISIQVTFNRIC